MKASRIPLALLLALLAGAFVAVKQQSGSGDQEMMAATKANVRSAESARTADAPEELSEADRTTREADFSPRPWQPAREAMPQNPESDPKPFSPEELAARKQAALDEVLAAIDLNPHLTREQGDRLAEYAGQLATNETPRVQCWSKDTPPEIVQAYLMAEQKIAAANMSLKALRGVDRWTRTATNGSGQTVQGTPVTITWSIVPDGTPITSSGSDDTSEASNLRARLGSIYGVSASGDPRAKPWFSVFQAVFNNLAANSGLRFVYEPDDDGIAIDGSSGSSDRGELGIRGDIRISGHLIDGNSNTLAYAYYPDNGDVVVDTGDNYILDNSNNSLRLRNIMEHEIGHSLGLAHVCPVNQTKLMEPFINLGFRGSQFDDIYSHQRNYGDSLEVHDSVRSNDTFTDATPLTLTPGTQSNSPWLSIDDSTDTDFYSFAAAATQQLTVRIIPSDPIFPNDPANDAYPEGAQNVDGSCSAGTAFDPTTQQDLVLDLIGPNGSTVVAAAPPQGAGVTEQITTYKFTATTGTHYIRVRGGFNDRAQLYRMEVLLEGIPPAPALVVTSKRFIAESNSGANGVPDPGETVQMGITLQNVGTLPANNLTAGIVSSAEVTPLSSGQSFGTLAPGESAERVYTFAVAGGAGQTVNVQLSASATGYSATVPFPVSLGADLGPAPLDEHFDASASLPAGWSQSVSGSGSPWVVSTNRFNSGPNSMHSPSVASAGESRLDSPAMTVGPGGGVLEFTHQYLLESARDGGVLEASRNGGAFFDLLNSAATVLAGDYNSSITASAGSAINGRQAWTGSAASFVSTSVRLPAAWAGESIVFRWRLVNNSTLVVTGWNIDDVKFFPLAVGDPFRPYVSLTSSGVSLSENTPAGTLSLFLSTPMPLAQPLPVPLEVSGTATPADLYGSLTITMPVGQTNITHEVGAVLDSLVEGTETLVLSLSPASPNFFVIGPSVVSLSIADAPVLSATVQLSNLVSNYNGNAKSATVTTTPSGLAVTVTYNGSTTPPVGPGQFTVVATVTTPGYVGSASGTLVINSPFSIWMSSYVNPADPIAAPEADLDGDGWDNLGEYAFSTFPNEANSRPLIEPLLTADSIWLFLQPAPEGVSRRVERSQDLKTWTEQGIIVYSFGYQMPKGSSQGYVRVVYNLTD